MRILKTVLPLLLLIVGTLAARAEEPFRIVGYLPEYRVLTIDTTTASQVTDLIFFSVTPTAEGGIDRTRMTPAIEKKLQEIRQRNPKLRLLLALGGADRSDGFGPMAADSKRRQKFIGELLTLCREHGFDGVDFDWEFPKDRAESDALEKLLLETRKAFAPQKLQVSMAIAPWDEFRKDVYAAVDMFHLMTYFDDSGHTPLALARLETEDLLRKGVDRRKICMGIPFYGEKVLEKSDTPTYDEIVAKYHPLPAVDEIDGIAFNGMLTVRQKTRYALEQHLGGVMIWEIGQDTKDGVLVNAIRTEITKSQQKK